MKLLVFADLHLDSQFAWAGESAEIARRLRRGIREALQKILRVAVEERVDAILCAGDLYEHERVTPDTAEFLRQAFAEVSPIPVVVSPGNHDWLSPNGVYRTNSWSPNVHIFFEARLEPLELVEGLRLWGGAFHNQTKATGFLEGFSAESGAANYALFHGSELGPLGFEEGKSPHAPFRSEEIEAANLLHAFVGHYHSPRHARFHTYPGNPETLTFGEEGNRGAILVELGPNGIGPRQLVQVATRVWSDLEVDVTGATTADQVLEKARVLVAARTGPIRLTLVGERHAGLDVKASDFQVLCDADKWVRAQNGALRPAYDLGAIRTEQTVRGEFVREVVDRKDLGEEDRQLILTIGLRALEGAKDLEVL